MGSAHITSTISARTADVEPPSFNLPRRLLRGHPSQVEVADEQIARPFSLNFFENLSLFTSFEGESIAITRLLHRVRVSCFTFVSPSFDANYTPTGRLAAIPAVTSTQSEGSSARTCCTHAPSRPPVTGRHQSMQSLFAFWQEVVLARWLAHLDPALAIPVQIPHEPKCVLFIHSTKYIQLLAAANLVLTEVTDDGPFPRLMRID